MKINSPENQDNRPISTMNVNSMHPLLWKIARLGQPAEERTFAFLEVARFLEKIMTNK